MPLSRHESASLAKGLLFLSPWLLGFAAFTALPILLSLYFSFCDYSLLQPPVYIGAANYRELFRDPLFYHSLGVTAQYSLMALPAGMLVSLGLALLLNQGIAAQTVYRSIIFLPSLVPAVATALLWLWIYTPDRTGLLNYFITELSLHTSNGAAWLVKPHLILPSLAFMSLWGVGQTVVIYLAGLQDVPRELFEAAEIDGATGIRRLWHVTLPMISPVIFFNLVMSIIGTLQVFTIPYIMLDVTGGGTDRAGYFFVMYLYDNAFTYLRMGYANAMAWVLLLLILSLTALAFWSSKRWVYYQGR